MKIEMTNIRYAGWFLRKTYFSSAITVHPVEVFFSIWIITQRRSSTSTSESFETNEVISRTIMVEELGASPSGKRNSQSWTQTQPT